MERIAQTLDLLHPGAFTAENVERGRAAVRLLEADGVEIDTLSQVNLVANGWPDRTVRAIGSIHEWVGLWPGTAHVETRLHVERGTILYEIACRHGRDGARWRLVFQSESGRPFFGWPIRATAYLTPGLGDCECEFDCRCEPLEDKLDTVLLWTEEEAVGGLRVWLDNVYRRFAD